MRYLLVILFSVIFLGACTSSEQGIIQDDPISTAQYLGTIHEIELSEEDITFTDQDFGENLGILPVYELENNGLVRLNNDDEVEIVSFFNVNKEQVEVVLTDIGIENNTNFNRVLDNPEDIYEEGHKTKYDNMHLNLKSNASFLHESHPAVRETLEETRNPDKFMLIVNIE